MKIMVLLYNSKFSAHKGRGVAVVCISILGWSKLGGTATPLLLAIC